MRTVVSSSEIYHLWAHQTQDRARAGNVFFEGDTIYSYGYHFPMARIVEHKGITAVLFNRDSYSVTTSGHQSTARAAVPDNWPRFYVSTGILRGFDPKRPAAALADYRERLERVLLDAARPRVKTLPRLEAARNIVAEANRFAEFFGLRSRLTLPEDFGAAVEAARTRQEAEDRRQAAALRKREAAALAAAKEAARKFEQEQLPAWRTGTLATNYLPHHDFAYLRLDGEEVETSKGARFPLEHAERAYRLLAALAAKREEYHANGHTIRVGHYGIDSFNPSAGNGGIVRAGCHRVRWEEIVRFAAQMGWTV